MITTLDAFNAALNNLQCWTEQFHHKGSLIITPENQTTESLLAVLEAKCYLPSTISWLNRAALKVRLYECPYELGSFDLIHHDIHVRIETGYLDVEVLPRPEERVADYWQSGGDDSMLEVKPEQLPEETWKLLRLLQALANEIPYDYPAARKFCLN